MKNIKPQLFNALYIALCIASMFFIVLDDKEIQPYVKPLVPISLLLFYILSARKINIFYLLIFPFLVAGHTFIIYTKEDLYFTLSLCCYFIVNVLNIISIYKNYLNKKSFFNIFTFALPFFMTFATVFILIYNDIKPTLLLPIFLFIITACINGAVVLLNYSQEQSISNYLIFVGTFTTISCYACTALYLYGDKNELYYQLLNLFDYLGQYALCRGVIIKQQDSKIL